MTEHIPEEVDVIDLPTAVVVGYAALALRATGTEGEEHALTGVSLQFQVAPGTVGQQTFLFHKNDVRAFRAALKNPTPVSNNSEDPTS